MKAFVLDANAVLRYLERRMDWEKIKGLLERAAKQEVSLSISVVNWGEAVYTSAKRVGLAQAIANMQVLGGILETIPVGEEEAEEAATLKFNYKLGYGDAFAAALAMRLNATLVSADPDFSKLGKRLKWMQLARFAG